MEKNFCDVIIVGAGASGLAAAWKLSNSKINISILDQGSKQDPKKYHKKNIEWDLLKKGPFNINPNLRKSISDYPIDCRNSDIDIANFNGIGGSTILYSGHFPRFHPSDFKVRTLDGVASDWPISYQEIEKFYEINDLITGIHGLEGDPAYPKIKNLKKPIETGLLGKKIIDAFNKLRWHCWTSYNDIDVENNFSVRTAKQNYITLIKKKKNVEIREKLRVIKIFSDNKKTKGVIKIDKNGIKKKIF